MTLRGTASLSPSLSAAFATKYYGGKQECDNVYAASSAWADVVKLGQFAKNMMPYIPGVTKYFLQFDALAAVTPAVTLAQGASGALDTYIDQFIANIVNAGIAADTIAVPMREYNGNWYRWSAVGHETDYANYFNRIATKCHAAGIKVALCMSHGTPNGYNCDAVTKLLTGADYFGVDFYNGKWQDTTVTPAQRWADMLGRTNGLNWAETTSKAMGIPLVVTEWGLNVNSAVMIGGSGGGDDDLYFTAASQKWCVDKNVYAFMALATDAESGNPHDMSHFPQSSDLMIRLWSQPLIHPGDVAGLQSQVSTLTSSNATLQSSNVSLAATNSSQASQITTLNAQITQLNADKTNLQNQINSMGGQSTNVTDLQNQVISMQASTGVAQSRVIDLQADKTALQAQVASLQSQLAAAQASATAANQQIADMRAVMGQ